MNMPNKEKKVFYIIFFLLRIYYIKINIHIYVYIYIELENAEKII
jgi:hypothetical protein